MKELEYIIATNRVKITNAIKAISETTHGEDYAISSGQKKVLLGTLHTIEDRLFKLIDGLMEHE